jgi:3-dehydroquinate synthase
MALVGYELELEQDRIPYRYGYDCLDEIAAEIARLEPDRLVIVTDDTVWGLHGASLGKVLAPVAELVVLSAPPGEGGKSLRCFESHVERAIRSGVSRRSVVVTFGGGVPGNLGGMIAALLLRGIRLVHIPTTVMAMFDSVISIKQALNSEHAKNLIGTYYVPEAIYTDLRFVETLSARELRSGLCEAIKNALAIHPHEIPRLRTVLRNPRSTESMRALLEMSLAAKIAVMRNDRRERRRGLVLEYGHTLGHAIEMLDLERNGHHALAHGEAVGLGMLAAAAISSSLGFLDEADREAHHELLEAVGLRPTLPDGLEPPAVVARAGLDNKRGHRASVKGVLDMVLLRRLGEPLGTPTVPLVPVPSDVALSALDELVSMAPPRRAQR